MTQRCPPDEEWVRFVDGEVTANRAGELAAHTDDCRRCRRQVEELRALTKDIAAPIAEPDSEAVARVMREVRGADGPAAARSARRPLWVLAGAAGVAAVAAVLLLMARGEPESEFRARGGPSMDTIRRNIGLFVYADGQPLRQDAEVRPEAAYQLGYTNLFQDPRDSVYLLLFAVDSAAEVHWLFPGFTDPESDPAAILLSRAASEVMLPDSVVLEAPPPGPMRVVAVLGDTPLSVSDIESLKPAQLRLPALQARWPQREMREITARVQP